MSLPLAMALVSIDGLIAVSNVALLATAGSGCRPGARPEALVIAEDATGLADAVRRAIAGGAQIEIRAALVTRPEEKQVITISPVPPGLGVGALLAMRDIREQLRLEAQVAAATRMQAVGQLAGGVAHDFNNILTAVLGITDQMIDRHPVGDPDHENLDEIRRNGLRAAALVAQLLAFARQQPQRQQVLDLETLIAALRPLLAQLLGKGIDLRIEGGPLRAAVRADPGQIEQVIVNLAVNARDAMSGAGSLTITVRDVPAGEIHALGHRIIPQVDHIAIDVVDTGAGIPAAIAGKIFEPFFTTKPMGEGTGLGLSTVYGIVKQSGGYIFASPSDGGRGTVFSVYLPAVTRLAARVVAPVVAAQAQENSLVDLRVLLVEDDAAVRAILERGLRRFGPVVTVAGDAMVALGILDEGAEFDVLVSDIMMPGIDGVELASRALAMRPGLGVVLMSGSAEAPLHRAASAQGVRFLAKPFALAELVAAIGDACPAH
ncbi:hybrid sensor histidine kinase/response regulator [Sandarakinorhabdus glacialis]|nr:ATP-binding protein [Polymorphobacter glacialis]